jgi:hypothetical protein
MKLALLLEKLKAVPEIEVHEHIQPDGRIAYIFASIYPFPRVAEPVWYVIVVKPGQEEIDDREIKAMLRHLWMYQLDLLPEDREDAGESSAATPTPKR